MSHLFIYLMKNVYKSDIIKGAKGKYILKIKSFNYFKNN